MYDCKRSFIFFSSSDLCWYEQLSAIIGARDVDKFKKKLREYTQSDMDQRKLKFTDMFIGPDHRDNDR